MGFFQGCLRFFATVNWQSRNTTGKQKTEIKTENGSDYVFIQFSFKNLNTLIELDILFFQTKQA